MPIRVLAREYSNFKKIENCVESVHNRALRTMSTHKFDDPEIQARFDEIKACRDRVIADDVKAIFDKYLHQLAKLSANSWEIYIADDDSNDKSGDECNMVADLLRQKDKRVKVTHDRLIGHIAWTFSNRS